VEAAGGSGCVAVNMSARQCRDRAFVAMVVDAIADAGIVPAQLSLEIAETMIGRSADRLAATLAELRSLGVHTVIDDFGTGSSSLQHLKRLPIDGVKIDRSLTAADAGVDSAEVRAVIEALVALGRALHLEVAAGGIDSQEQLALVRESGCTLAQGSVFAPAMPENVFLRWSPPAEPTGAISER
jgi:EAL domain-containing protein (putative c-di-GMP-specific phosphodiesterase class I)